MSKKEKTPKTEKVTNTEKRKISSENLKDVSGGRFTPYHPRGPLQDSGKN